MTLQASSNSERREKKVAALGSINVRADSGEGVEEAPRSRVCDPFCYRLGFCLENWGPRRRSPTPTSHASHHCELSDRATPGTSQREHDSLNRVSFGADHFRKFGWSVFRALFCPCSDEILGWSVGNKGGEGRGDDHRMGWNTMGCVLLLFSSVHTLRGGQVCQA